MGYIIYIYHIGARLSWSIKFIAKKFILASATHVPRIKLGA